MPAVASASLPSFAPLAAALAVDDRDRAARLLGVLDTAMGAVDPEPATGATLPELGALDPPVTIVALGKAAPAMARGMVAALAGTRIGPVVVVSDHHEEVPVGTEFHLGAHPVPDLASVAAGLRLLEVVGAAEGTVLVLVSGGGSSLAEVPAPGLDLADVSAVYRLVLRSGMPIEDANTIRAHLSSLKGGRLAGAAPGPVATVVLSDVADRPALIASGPTVRCSTSPADALAILDRHRLVDIIPPQVVAFLRDAPEPPTPPEGPVVVAADGARAATAAVGAARDAGLRATVLTTHLRGRAVEAAQRALTSSPPDTLAVLAGETTVAVTGSGRGGRNQEAALAAAIAIEGGPVVFVALGTDGIDGPTDAAGAYVDGSTARRIRAAGIDPVAALADNDSHTALDAASALLRSGPTGVNVADLWLVDKTPH